jgi:lysozyme
MAMIDWLKLSDELKVDEGFRSRVYECTAGKQTIGYGHNLEDCDLPVPVAEALLKHDYMEVYTQLTDWQWFCELDDYRKRIIINMGFNMGVNGVLKFKMMINAIMDKDYNEAANQMENSNWYNQVGYRAVRLVAAMRNGE